MSQKLSSSEASLSLVSASSHLARSPSRSLFSHVISCCLHPLLRQFLFLHLVYQRCHNYWTLFVSFIIRQSVAETLTGNKGRERERERERDMGMTCNKCPLPDLNQGHFGYVTCVVTTWLYGSPNYLAFKETLVPQLPWQRCYINVATAKFTSTMR